MTPHQDVVCPGCGLVMPRSEAAWYEGYYNTSAECWSVYTEVLGHEFGSAYIFGKVHQLTVDSYAVQHAGGPHPDKSVGIHLAGLHLALEQGVAPTSVPPLLHRLANRVETWPHFPPPADRGAITVFDVALAGSPQEHVRCAREWAAAAWAAWSAYHDDVAALVARYLSE